MASNGGERAGGVAGRSDSSVPAGAAGRGEGVDIKTRAETPRTPKPRQIEFGWDFPFDSPKPKG